MRIFPIEYTQNGSFIRSTNHTVRFPGISIRIGNWGEYYPIENKNNNGYWTSGIQTDNLVIKSNKPLRKISFLLSSGSIDNCVTLSDGQILNLHQNSPITVVADLSFAYKFYGKYYYDFSISPEKSFIPSKLKLNSDKRDLGVYISNIQVE